MSKIAPLRVFFKVIVWILRGTPLMLQLFVIFYGPGLLGLFRWPSVNTGWAWFDTTFDTRFIAALVAFAINYAAYFSEIYRGGIQSISNGQYEAGQVLGMTKSQIFFRVVLFQVIKRILPAMGNEVITLVKDTSLARVIVVTELVKAAEDIVGAKGIIWPIFYIGAFYLAVSGALTLLFGWLEKKMDYYKG
jgi:polar amino acid transport system permease protein